MPARRLFVAQVFRPEVIPWAGELPPPGWMAALVMKFLACESGRLQVKE